MSVILSRRSVRQFAPGPVDEEVLRSVLEAGMSAPSAGNQRIWHFVVVRDRGRLAELGGMSPFAKPAKEAAAAVAVCADLELERFPGFWPQDCAAAVQNMLLQIESSRLGGVWLGVYPMEERVDYVRTVLALPKSVVPFAVVAFGTPVSRPEPIARWDASRVHQETW